ncbi:MAG TPA: WYL domain-containing protein [Chloroflexota bacterium]|nr:WYL domain-containing protein [Chloroflexota bacterium]
MRFAGSGTPRLEETKRIGRVLAMVERIRAEPRRWSRSRLAESFEISERMVDNDLQLIRNALRCELCRDRSGYYFERGPLLHPLQLTLPEVLALTLAAQEARDTGSVDPSTIAGVLGKLEAALPAGVVPYVRRAAAERAQALVTPVRDRAAVLRLLKQAMLEERAVQIAYISASRGNARSERAIEPYWLMPYQDSWQVIARDSLRQAVRMFKVDRIDEARLTGEHFRVPDDFDLESYFGATWGVLRGEGGEPEDVVLRFSPLGAAWVRDERRHPSQEIEELPDGGITMRFFCTVTHELVRWVLSFGGEASVEEPEQLRQLVSVEAARVLDVVRER